MKQLVTTSPPNSILLVMSSKSGEAPETFSGNVVSHTESCVAIQTLCEIDGETLLLLTDDIAEIFPSMHNLLFEGEIAFADHEISVVNSHNEVILSQKMSGQKARIQVWANEIREPNQIGVVARPS
jgi:hypothetical protein